MPSFFLSNKNDFWISIEQYAFFIQKMTTSGRSSSSPPTGQKQQTYPFQGDFHHRKNWARQAEDTLIAAGSSRTTKAQEILASDCVEEKSVLDGMVFMGT